MKHQALRPVALMLSFLLLAAVPAKAGTVHFADAVHALSSGRGAAADVRLRFAPQSGGSTVAQQSGQSGASSQQPSGTSTPNITPTTSTDTTLSQSGGQIETVDLGDVTGTVCDCGEIPIEKIPGAGFPWWPFLGIPLICVSGICGGGNDTPPPPSCVVNCGPPPPAIPEPATLLLFGTSLLALGASARRRYSRRRNGEESVAEEVI